LFHACFPGDEGSRESLRVHAAVTADERVGKKERLFGVVCDRSRRHPRSDRMVWACGFEACESAKLANHFCGRQQLGGHAEGVADG
jgi:hypothetical protein